MAIKAPVGNSEEFELVPAGVYLARCYKMVDIGTQQITSAKFGTKDVRQVIIYWELLQDDDGEAVFMKDGKRVFSISKTYTLSMHKKANLRADLDAWRGKPFTDAEAADFDVAKLLGVPCKIQVVHNTSGDKVYANVGSIMTTKKKVEGVNSVVEFSIDSPDMKVFEELPQWLKDKIQGSAEWDDDTAVDADTEQSADVEDDKIDVADVPF